MKFAIINDLHVGPPNIGYHKGIQRKLSQFAERLMYQFIQEMNTVEHPDFVMVLGDMIEDIMEKNTDLQSFTRVTSLLSQLKMPLYYAVGNHDIRTISQQEIARMLGIERMNYSFELGGYHCVVLSFSLLGEHTKNLADIRAAVPPEQLTWLQSDLAQTKQPSIVFIHYGVAEDDMQGNFWFADQAHHAVLANREKVREILENSKKVKAVFSAHQHWNRMHIHNGIPYFVTTSLIENTHNDGVASGAYTIVTLTNKDIVVEVHGNDPARFVYTF